jgi:outer membrane protein assembly factor BamA
MVITITSKQYIENAVWKCICIPGMPEAFTSADLSKPVSALLGTTIDRRRIAWSLNSLYQQGYLNKLRVSCNDSGNKANIFMLKQKEET